MLGWNVNVFNSDRSDLAPNPKLWAREWDDLIFAFESTMSGSIKDRLSGKQEWKL